MKPTIAWLGHSSIRIEGSYIIYIDPYKLKETNPPKADFIFITHPHFDHLSDVDIKKISKESTIFISTLDTVEQLKGNKYAIKPYGELEFKNLKISAVPSYNITKAFHPKKNEWVGFVINLDDTTFYYAGDTDAVPEIEKVKADIIFLPVGGTYTMTSEEAAKIASKISPKVAIPVHYGSVIGSANDAIQFKRYSTCPVKIFQEGERWVVDFNI